MSTIPDATTGTCNNELLPDPGQVLARLGMEYTALEYVNELVITHIKFRENSPVQFLFEGESESGPRVYVSAQRLPMNKGMRLEEQLNLTVAHSSAVPSSSKHQRHAVYSSELGMLFQLFPQDRYLPALSCLVNTESVKPILRSAISGFETESDFCCTDCTVMRYKPHRKCMIRYRLQFRYGGYSTTRCIYGKVSRDKYFTQTCSILRQLRQVVSDTVLQLPRPLAVIPESCVELITEVPGTPLSKLCESDQFAHYCAVTAQALAGFHEAPSNLPLRWTIGDKITRITKDASSLVALLPDERQTIQALKSRLISRFRSLPVAPLQLIHRDFHGMNVLLHNTTVGFIDLEDCAMGDPAEDIGSLYGHLSRLAFEQPDLSKRIVRGRQAFLQGYPRVLSRHSVQLHCALYCFYQSLQQLRHPQYSYRYRVARALLRECDRVLTMAKV